jgi:hypothetical protein
MRRIKGGRTARMMAGMAAALFVGVGLLMYSLFVGVGLG